MKILYIAQWRNSIYDQLFESLENLGITIKAVVSKNFNQTSNAKGFYLFSKSREYSIPMSDFPLIIDFPDLENILLEEKPDIIISNLFYQLSTWRACRLAKIHKIPFVLQTEVKYPPKNILMRSIMQLVFKFFFQKYKNNIKAIIAWTEDSKKFIINQTRFHNAHSVIPGIDFANFKPKENMKSQSLRVLMVARYTPYKNHLDALKALKRFTQHYNSKIVLTCIGHAGEMKKKIHEKVKKMRLNPHVRFIEKVPYKDMPKVFNNHDALILPSYNEAIGLVVGEAMACGLPVIVSDTVGAKDYVDEKSGIIFRTGDVFALAQAMHTLQDVKKRQAYGKNALKRIQKFSIENQAKKYNSILESVVGN